MPNTYEGELTAKGIRFAIVVSRFNEVISKRLLEGAIDCIVKHQGDEKNIDIYWVPGAWEIPLVIKKIIKKNYDAIIPLGAVIRGETPHFDYIATEVTKGIARLSQDFDIPIVLGILTCDTTEQAIDRSGGKLGNKGKDAALSAIELVNLLKKVK